MLNFFTSPFPLFRCYPALELSIAALFGVFFSLTNSPFILIFIPLFLVISEKKWFFFATFFCFFFYTNQSFLIPQNPEKKVPGSGIFSPSSITATPFSKKLRWTIKGTLHTFIAKEEQTDVLYAKNIPLSLTYLETFDHPLPSTNHLWKIEGILFQNQSGQWLLNIPKKTQIQLLDKQRNLTSWRYTMKKKLQDLIYSFYKHKETKEFLSSLIIGQVAPSSLSHEISRFGLQHILAVSGFHFSCLALFLTYFLSWIPSKRLSIFLILLFLCSYLFLLGPSPSVLRAWISISISLVGTLFNKQAHPLNSLGLALLASLLFHPFSCLLPAFQFSFSSVAAILIFYPLTEAGLAQLLPQRDLVTARKLSHLEQGIYCFLHLFKKAFALTLAVSCTAIPLTLFYFKKFPLLSFIYNLFFPTLAGYSLILFLLGGISFFFFPFLGKLIHFVTDEWVSFSLHLIYAWPQKLEPWIYTPPFQGELLASYLFFLFLGGMVIYKKREIDDASKQWFRLL